ncbi:MAG: hypothetical protein M3N53_13540 [Actinomycetota bacterium]|nr:hypothetical protein [Actinomycetota bacterium]
MGSVRKISLGALALVVAFPALAAAGDFSPEFSFTLSDTRVKANPQMTLKLAQENGEEELGHVTLKIPAGFKLPPDAAVPNNDQIGTGSITIAAGPGCRPGAPLGDAKAPFTAPATLREQDRADDQADAGIYAVWVLDISGVTKVPLEIRGSKATGYTIDGDIPPNDNTCPPFSFELKVNSQTASGVPVLKNPRFTGGYKFVSTWTSADSPAVVTIPQRIKITR